MRHILLGLTTLVVFALNQPLTGQGKMQRWSRTATSTPEDGQWPIFYFNKDNEGEILILDDDRAYLIDTKKRSVRRVISHIPKTSKNFEVGEIKAQILENTTPLLQHIAGTPKFAGGMIWLGWSIWFMEGENARSYTVWRVEQEDP